MKLPFEHRFAAQFHKRNGQQVNCKWQAQELL
jgi:hypothetical protein